MPRVQVAVRCRPPLPKESESPCTRIETNEIDHTVRLHMPKAGDKVFTFDHVLPTTANQEDVFEITSPMIDHALDGLHATIFAYGQTGSGKTYSMEGIRYIQEGQNGTVKPDFKSTKQTDHGVMLRCVEAIFERANSRMSHNPNIRYKIQCSYYQLYNERVSDLLNPASCTAKEGLKIRWARDDHFSVQNLFIFECDDADQVRELITMGVKNKTMGSHAMNQQSSRSHCVFTIYVHSWDPDQPECIVKSELSLVDLAGSEKLTLLASDPSPQLLKESIEINTSLLSLGKVITSLATNSKGHIPYRDSKLTKLLKHALGGNSMTLMLACISPLDSSVEESLSTLMYAGRARNITNEPRVNEDPRSALIRQLREEILQLRSELEYYRKLVMEGGALDPERMEALLAKHQGGSSHRNGAASASGGANDSALSNPSTDPEMDLPGKLIATCNKLKDVISLNTQLRNAFDKMNELKVAAEKREVELNAENIALRERIEMLESIAMQEATGLDTPTSQRLTSSQSETAASGDSSAREKPTRRPPEKTSTTASSASVQQSSSTNNLRKSQGFLHAPLDDPYRGGLSFQERLSAYNKKYHNPSKGPDYESYYGVAKKQAVGARVSAQLNEDIDRLMKKVAPGHQGLIPQSLQVPSGFGSLSFGGSTSDSAAFEEKRRQREARRMQLQEMHNAMQAGAAPSAAEIASTIPSATAIVTGTAQIPQRAPQASSVSMSQSMHSVGSGRRPNSDGPTNPRASHEFSYISQEESRGLFTPEQLALLRNRASLPMTGGVARGNPTGASLPSGSGANYASQAASSGGLALTSSHDSYDRLGGSYQSSAPPLQFSSSSSGSAAAQRLLEQLRQGRPAGGGWV